MSLIEKSVTEVYRQRKIPLCIKDSRCRLRVTMKNWVMTGRQTSIYDLIQTVVKNLKIYLPKSRSFSIIITTDK